MLTLSGEEEFFSFPRYRFNINSSTLRNLTEADKSIRERMVIHSPEYNKIRYGDIHRSSREPAWMRRIREKRRAENKRHLFLHKSDDLFLDFDKCVGEHIPFETPHLSYRPATGEVLVQGDYVATFDAEHSDLAKWTLRYNKSPLALDLLRHFDIPIWSHKKKPFIILPLTGNSVLAFDMIEDEQIQWEDILGYGLYTEIYTKEFEYRKDDDFFDRTHLDIEGNMAGWEGGRLLYLGVSDVVYTQNLTTYTPLNISFSQESIALRKLIPIEQWDEPKVKEKWLTFNYEEDTEKLNRIIFNNEDVERVSKIVIGLFKKASRSLHWFILLRNLFIYRGVGLKNLAEPQYQAILQKKTDFFREDSEDINQIYLTIKREKLYVKVINCMGKAFSTFVTFDDEFRILFGIDENDEALRIINGCSGTSLLVGTGQGSILLKMKLDEFHGKDKGRYPQVGISSSLKLPLFVEGSKGKYYGINSSDFPGGVRTDLDTILTNYPKFLQNKTIWGPLI